MRKAFSFYRSHYEQLKLLNSQQISEITLAICEVQFLETHLDDISFPHDNMTQVVWTGIKHGIEASVKGYANKKGNIELPLARGSEKVTTPLARGSENVSTPLEQVEEEEEEKGEEEEEEKEQYVESQLLPLSKSELSATRVADYLHKRILMNKPNFKQPNIKAWEKDIEKAIRIDNRTERELVGAIEWIYGTKRGEFWIANVMSGRKLRDKFDTMEAQMNHDKQPENAVLENIAMMEKLREERLNA